MTCVGTCANYYAAGGLQENKIRLISCRAENDILEAVASLFDNRLAIFIMYANY